MKKPIFVGLGYFFILLLTSGNLKSAIFNLADDTIPKPSTVVFYGNSAAGLFSKEISASFGGVFKHSFFSTDSIFPAGFVRTSPAPQLCCDQFWSRDGGTFLRELVMWNYSKEARQVARCLINLVGKNKDGYFAFPMYFDSYKKTSGNELDGTCTVVIGLILLYNHLDEQDPMKQEIYNFLHAKDSPVAFIKFVLQNNPLVSGEGEFGGGMWIDGPYYNVVQNHLCALALDAYSNLEKSAGDIQAAASAKIDANRLTTNMYKYLVSADNTWIWCVDPKTMTPDSAILNSLANKGFSGINGVMSMYADVSGFEPGLKAKKLSDISKNTFLKLYNDPARKRQFDKYGIWTQFDILAAGSLSSPAYGMGYCIQDLLLYDNLQMASKALNFLTKDTYSPIPEYTDLKRESPYYFYERMYSPEAVGKMKIEQGCGALNLVNISEPFKIARLIVGIDDSNPDTLKLIPRLPEEWTGFSAKNWLVNTKKGPVNIQIECKMTDNKMHFSCITSKKIETIVVRLYDKGKWVYHTFKVTNSFKI